MAPKGKNQCGMAMSIDMPSLESPPSVSPIVHSVRRERDIGLSIARERPLWVDHVA